MATTSVDGRYRGQTSPYELELRVDLDGGFKALSGDVFEVAGSTRRFKGSFRADSPLVAPSPGQLVASAKATSTFDFDLKVTATFTGINAPAQARKAVVVFDALLGLAQVTFECAFESTFLRTVHLKTNTVSGVPHLDRYKTGSLPLPEGVAAREMGVVEAFADAGIEILSDPAEPSINIAEAGDGRWDDGELHNAMAVHFKHVQESELQVGPPAWRVWLLEAGRHAEADNLGIMFDSQGPGPQRQGCAIFHAAIASSGMEPSEISRLRLFAAVHEIGHCFNLCHCGERPDRDNGALTWMNHPLSFAPAATLLPLNGEFSPFFRRFPFQFDRFDQSHLRHGFYPDVVMGGKPFAGTSRAIDPGFFADPIADRSGLALGLRAASSYYLGEPVVLEVKLRATDGRHKRVHTRLAPQDGFVQVAIQQPGGATVLYRPFFQTCSSPAVGELDRATPACYANAYVGYGKDGLYFDQPGTYRLRASYANVDGSRLVSNVVRLRVEAPANARESDLADRLVGDQQGQLFGLRGSRSELLAEGRDQIAEVIARHGDHPLGIHAKLLDGASTARPFKRICPRTGRLSSTPPDRGYAIAMISQAVDDTIAANPEALPTAEVGLDNITLGHAMVLLAQTYLAAGDAGSARRTVGRIVSHFHQPSIPAPVQETLRRRAVRVLTDADREEGVEQPAETRRRPQARRLRGTGRGKPAKAVVARPGGAESGARLLAAPPSSSRQ
jgi:hypothetical protein